MDGSSTATGGSAERSPNDVGEHLRAFHHRAPLRGSPQKSLLVDGSERSLAFIDNRHIGREHDHVYRRSIGFGHAWDHVSCPTTAWGFGDAGFVRQAGVGIGHKRCRALVSGHDVRDLVPSRIERVVEYHGGIAGHSKDVFNPVFFEQFDQDLGSIHRLSCGSFSRICSMCGTSYRFAFQRVVRAS